MVIKPKGIQMCRKKVKLVRAKPFIVTKRGVRPSLWVDPNLMLGQDSHVCWRRKKEGLDLQSSALKHTCIEPRSHDVGFDCTRPVDIFTNLVQTKTRLKWWV